MSKSGNSHATAAVYTPAQPVTVISNTTLSQDVVVSSEIIVPSTSPNPAATFLNPASNLTEGLAIMEPNGTSQLYWINRQQSSETGWAASLLFQGVTALEVVTGSADGNLYGFYSDGAQVWVTQFVNGTWGSPTSCYSGAASNLAIAYTPFAQLIVYGQTSSGELLTINQPTVGGAFTSTAVPVTPSLTGNFYLAMADENSYVLVANIAGVPTTFTALIGATGALTGSTTQGFNGVLSNVVLGYWCGTINALVFLLVDTDGTLQFWNESTNSAVGIQSVPNAGFVTAQGYLDGNNNIHIYAATDTNTLVVLHQMGVDENNLPSFAPPIPIDSDVLAITANLSALQPPAIFAISTEYSLSLYAQDSNSMMWQSNTILQPGTTAYNLTRYRTEINFVDANGVPQVNYACNLQCAPNSSATGVAIGGQSYLITSLATTAVATDATGKLTIATPLTNGVATPDLQVTSADVVTPVTVSPSGPLMNYLNGNGTWNAANPDGGLPVFDSQGNTLANANVGGNALAPVVANNPSCAPAIAQAIQQTAAAGSGNNSGSGFQITNNNNGTISCQLFATREELEACLAKFPPPQNGYGSIFTFFGDLWSGLVNGVITIENAVVNFADSVIQIAIKIGQEVYSGLQVAISAVEAVGAFIGSVFQLIGAAIEDLIEWLKALFDFAAIWNTMLAFQSILQNMPSAWISLAQQAQGSIASFFSTQASNIQQDLQSYIKNAPNTQYGNQQGVQPPGPWQNNSTQLGSNGNASVSDVGSNPHGSWLQDKVTSNPPPFSGGDDPTVTSDWATIGSQLDAAWGDVTTALNDFTGFLSTVVSDPSAISTIGLQDLMSALSALFAGMMEVAGAAGEAIVASFEAVLSAINDYLNTPITDSFLVAIWNFIAPSDPPPLTISGIISLVAAFPTTVLYFLIEGTQPFPNGNADVEMAFRRQPGDGPSPVSQGCALTAGILRCVAVIPAGAADYLSPLCPSWITAVRYVMATVEYFLWNGSPAFLANVNWGITEAVGWYGTCISPYLFPYLQAVYARYQALSSDVKNTILTVYGVVDIIYRFYVDSEANPTPSVYMWADAAVEPIPNIVRLLNISPPLIPTQWFIVFDAIGFLGGGACRILQASNDWPSVIEQRKALFARTMLTPGIATA